MNTVPRSILLLAWILAALTQLMGCRAQTSPAPPEKAELSDREISSIRECLPLMKKTRGATGIYTLASEEKPDGSRITVILTYDRRKQAIIRKDRSTGRTDVFPMTEAQLSQWKPAAP
jgi:hypothetical protein